jgi:predicted RNase H-like nuclease (RuvC/YqgF family)
MAECFTCHTALQGSWNMASGYGHARTGRNLGITNGHFLHHPGPNWVYSYCEACWKNAILALPFVPRTSQALQEQNNALTQQLETSRNEKTSLERQLDNLRQENALLKKQLEASRMIDADLKVSLSEMQIESATLKQKNKELNDRCSYVLYIAGIEKLQDVCRQLKPTQIEALKTQTHCHIDQLDEQYTQQQLRCSEQFTKSIVMDLKSKLKTIIAEQNEVSKERQDTAGSSG